MREFVEETRQPETVRCRSAARLCGISGGLAPLAALLRPGEVGNGDDEEAVVHVSKMTRRSRDLNLEMTHLLELSAIPARALYQARKAANRPK